MKPALRLRRSFPLKRIKAIREAEHVSQPVLARYLNVSKNLVSDRERGAKKPGGPALRLLSIIQRSGWMRWRKPEHCHATSLASRLVLSGQGHGVIVAMVLQRTLFPPGGVMGCT